LDRKPVSRFVLRWLQLERDTSPGRRKREVV
jgi:hypothetical protein